MPVGVVRRINALSQQVDFGLQPLRRDSRFQPADHAEQMSVRMLLKKRTVQCCRHPELHVSLGKIEPLRHDTNNGVRLAVQRDWLAQHIRTLAELIPPNRIAQNNDMVLSHFSFRFQEDAAESGVNVQRLEKGWRDQMAEQEIGFTRTREREPVPHVARKSFEDFSLLLPRAEFSR